VTFYNLICQTYFIIFYSWLAFTSVRCEQCILARWFTWAVHMRVPQGGVTSPKPDQVCKLLKSMVW